MCFGSWGPWSALTGDLSHLSGEEDEQKDDTKAQSIWDLHPLTTKQTCNLRPGNRCPGAHGSAGNSLGLLFHVTRWNAVTSKVLQRPVNMSLSFTCYTSERVRYNREAFLVNIFKASHSISSPWLWQSHSHTQTQRLNLKSCCRPVSSFASGHNVFQ